MDEGRKGVEIGQPGALPAGQSPVRRKRLFDGHWTAPAAVLKADPALENLMTIIDAVGEGHRVGMRPVAKAQPERLTHCRPLDAILFKDPLDHPRAVGILHLEARLTLAGCPLWHGKISGPAWIGRHACSRT